MADWDPLGALGKTNGTPVWFVSTDEKLRSTDLAPPKDRPRLGSLSQSIAFNGFEWVYGCIQYAGSILVLFHMLSHFRLL